MCQRNEGSCAKSRLRLRVHSAGGRNTNQRHPSGICRLAAPRTSPSTDAPVGASDAGQHHTGASLLQRNWTTTPRSVTNWPPDEHSESKELRGARGVKRGDRRLSMTPRQSANDAHAAVIVIGKQPAAVHRQHALSGDGSRGSGSRKPASAALPRRAKHHPPGACLRHVTFAYTKMWIPTVASSERWYRS